MSDVDFKRELESTINRNSMENGSNTPDFILAEFMYMALSAFEQASNARQKWYGVNLAICQERTFTQGELDAAVQAERAPGPCGKHPRQCAVGDDYGHEICQWCTEIEKLKTELRHSVDIEEESAQLGRELTTLRIGISALRDNWTKNADTLGAEIVFPYSEMYIETKRGCADELAALLNEGDKRKEDQ